MVEALVAAAIFGLGALALTQLNASLVRHAEAAQHRSEATLLAQAQLDELRAALAGLPPEAPLPVDIGHFDGAAVIGADAPANATTAFDRRWRVQAAAADDPALRRIDVQVRWVDRDGRVDPGVALALLLPARDPARRLPAAPGEPPR
ncbi:MAG TPA: hypothetical protein VFR90_00265 [Methylibium sp.]|uniref:hypothetical protein n=1 Tax=Methylibium sp. TaxID=2067992 RepID=UPI002DB649FF|nr:hypothetical protein [Methylibium sp.]HEU4457538.1 hypothetical protein [Methylibium sp.]